MSLTQQIKKDFLTAFKNKQDLEKSVLVMLKTALTNKEIEKKLPKGQDLPDAEVVAVVKSEIKKRQDSSESYRQGQRPELAEKEEREAEILRRYLPAQLPDDEVRAVVAKMIKSLGASGSADFGKVMGAVMGQLAGQADGQTISQIVKEELT